jgi:hypothetical protein
VHDAAGRELLVLYEEMWDPAVTLVVAREGAHAWPAWPRQPPTPLLRSSLLAAAARHLGDRALVCSWEGCSPNVLLPGTPLGCPMWRHDVYATL